MIPDTRVMPADVFFITNMLFRFFQSMVVDLGFAESSVDKIVDYTEGVQRDSGQAAPRHRELAASALAQGNKTFGPSSIYCLKLILPVRAATIFPLWAGFAAGASTRTMTLLLIPRILRLRFLLNYLRAVRTFVVLCCMSARCRLYNYNVYVAFRPNTLCWVHQCDVCCTVLGWRNSNALLVRCAASEGSVCGREAGSTCEICLHLAQQCSLDWLWLLPARRKEWLQRKHSRHELGNALGTLTHRWLPLEFG